MSSSPVSRRRILPGAVALSVFCCLLAAAVAMSLATPAAAAPAQAPAEQGCRAGVTVTNTADSDTGSLRQALIDVCAGGTVDFDAALLGQTIVLTTGQIAIDKDVTITGTVPITLSGGNVTRLIYVTPGADVTLHGLFLTEGNPGPGESGGAINNYGTLLVVNSSLTNNTADGGGAIYNDSTAILAVVGSRISNNTSTSSGGGIANMGAMTVTNSTVAANQAATAGGGLINANALILAASTIANNQAPNGAGIYNNTGMPLKVSQVTVSANNASGSGGGLFANAGATLTATVLSGNSPNDCLPGPTIGTGGYNVVSDDKCTLGDVANPTDHISAGAQTDALQPNGTAPLLPLATARGSVSDAALCANLDQLGYPRHTPPCDPGALEFNELYTLTVAKTGTGSGVLTPTVGAHIYVSNTLVSVEAAPLISSTLDGWSGDCTGTGACAITMLAERVVTATFALKQFTVTVSADPAAGGTVQGGGTYAYGSTVVVTATTNTGYTFDGWKESSSVVAATAVYTFTATADRTLTAAFTPVCPVTNNADSGGGSLRDAVANAAPGAILCFNPPLLGQSILFSSPIVITKSLTINGNLPVILDGQGSYRLFEVTDTGSLSLNALTLRNGKGASPGGGAILVASGGTLAATGVTFGGNQAAGKGGAVLNGGTTTISHSTFSANSAGQGGGIANDGGTATVSSSVFGANTGGGCGGTITSGGYNVAADGSCNFTGRGDINDAPVPVAGVGAYSRMPLTADSLAVNNVTDPALCTGTDQAGNPRPTPCSSGALEFVTAATSLYVAPGGSDTGNNCASSPCATLTHALEVASDGSTIRMAGGTPYILSNQPISKSVFILGDGSGQTILQAGAAPASTNGRVLGVVPGQKVTLYGVTVRYGWTSGQAAGGAGILNGGTLTVRNSAVLSNTIVAGNGAGIYNGGGGLLVVYNSTLAGNRVIRQTAAAMAPGAVAGAIPGAIPGLPVSALPGLVGLLSSGGMLGLAWTVTGGRPKRPWLRRTALLFLAMLVLSGCTGSCATPTDGAGGAIFNDHGSTAVVRFTTLAGNSAYAGGGAFFNATTTYDINGNLTQPAGVLKLAGSVLSQNEIGNCSGSAVESGGANVSSDITCALGKATDANFAGDQVGTLGSTGIMPLQAASGAVDLVPAACPGTDQVGIERTAPCDGGAAESGNTAAARLMVAVSADPGRPYLNQAIVFTTTVRNTGAAAAVNPVVTLTWPNGITAAPPFDVTGGDGCGWESDTALTCTSLAARRQVEMVIRGRLTTSGLYLPLNFTVAATAAAPAEGGTGTGTVITGPVPPPPPLAVGATRYYKTIQSAVDAAPSGETITVDDGTYVENVVINKSLTIRRTTDADVPIVDGNHAGSVLTIGSGSVVTLDGLTIRNGSGKIDSEGDTSGGGIYNDGELVLNNCTISDNQALGDYGAGGGIFSYGSLVVSNCFIHGNSASGSNGKGGGIFSAGTFSPGWLAVSNSSFVGNNAASGGAINMSRARGAVRHSTFSGNTSSRGAVFNAVGANNNLIKLTVQDSIMSGNDGRALLLASDVELQVENSIVQEAIGGTNNTADVLPRDLFVRPPSAGDYGDLHLLAKTPAEHLGQFCTGTDAQDMVGTTRKTPTCDAGAYEYLSTDAGSGQVAVASAGTTVFPNAAGAVTLTVPTGAAAQAVELAFSIGQPTGGDGRALGVVFTPYDAVGQPLGENFTFLKPLQLTLEYNPALVTHGPEQALLPMRFQPSTGSWLPFTQNVVVDRPARTVTFPITQAGEYGLFSFTPGAHVSITPFKAGGTANLDGGSTVLYTLAVVNADYAPAANLVISHTLPAGLSFGSWVNAGSATQNNGLITWNLPALAGGGFQSVSFNALVSADAAYRGQAITSRASLAGAGGLTESKEAAISVNGPTIAIADDATTRPGTPVSLQPLLNDINPDGSPVRLTDLIAPVHGTATILGNTVLYTPTAGYEGTDTLMYRLRDGLFTAQALITVRSARLAFLNVAKFAASSGASGINLPAVAQGSTVTYTILLENMIGGEVAQNAVLTDVLPAGVKFTRWITQSGATLNGSTITWSAVSLPVGSGATISYAATVSGTSGTRIANIAQASAANADTVSGQANILLGSRTSIYLPQVRR